MGIGVEEPSETEQLAAGVEQLEQSRSSTDVDAAFQQGQRELQAAHEAQHQVEQYRNQLLNGFAQEFPEINSNEDLQAVASYDPDREVAAVTSPLF